MKSSIFLLLVFLTLILVLPACAGLSEADTHYNAGVEFQEQGRLPEAITEYDEAIRLNPELAEAYYNRGIAYDDLGQPERAIEDYNEAIRLNSPRMPISTSTGALPTSTQRNTTRP